MLAVNVEWIPVGDFFTRNPLALGVLDSAAKQITSRLENQLAAIPQGYRWTAAYSNPATGARVLMKDAGIPSNTLRVFVGGRDLADNRKAEACSQQSGGPTCGILFDATGLAKHRGQGSRISTWGGSISFDSLVNWHFGTGASKVPSVKTDFYSVALHEMGHLLGFNAHNQDPLVRTYNSGTFWQGPEVIKVNRGIKPKLSSDHHHWDDFVRSEGRKAVMTDSLGAGFAQRRFTAIDFAALKDAGWKIATSGTGAAAREARFSASFYTDKAVWRPSLGNWYVAASIDSPFQQSQWGLPGDVPVNGDFDRDGRTDFAVWRPSNGVWYQRLSTLGFMARTIQWGLQGDVPLAGDFDGDAQSDLAVFRPSNSTWYIGLSGGGSRANAWGIAGDVPIPADFDGDGVTDIAVWRPSNGTWYVAGSSDGVFTQPTWGVQGDIPVPADYDGDQRADFAVWRPSLGQWFVIYSSNRSVISQQWGLPGDIPQPADFDGDGRADMAVWRPSNGNWYAIYSTDNQPRTQQWGLPGDIPVANVNAANTARRIQASPGRSSVTASMLDRAWSDESFNAPNPA